MFKKGLLSSTALIVAVSVACLAAPTNTAEGSRIRNNVAGRDTNGEFLCTYGQFGINAYSHAGSSSSYDSGWTHVAVPIVGHGRTVNHIIVQEVRGIPTYRAKFSAAIYSNTPSGLPGRLIAGGTAWAHKNCRESRIAIPPTLLKPKTRYWIEEQVPFPAVIGEDAVYWAVDPHRNSKAYVQNYYFYFNGPNHSSASYTSPWTQQSTGAYFRLR